MLELIIQERHGGWGFDGSDDSAVAKTPLMAALKAMEYGESLRGEEVGYVIKSWAGRDLVTLHFRVF